MSLNLPTVTYPVAPQVQKQHSIIPLANLDVSLPNHTPPPWNKNMPQKIIQAATSTSTKQSQQWTRPVVPVTNSNPLLPYGQNRNKKTPTPPKNQEGKGDYTIFNQFRKNLPRTKRERTPPLINPPVKHNQENPDVFFKENSHMDGQNRKRRKKARRTRRKVTPNQPPTHNRNLLQSQLAPTNPRNHEQRSRYSIRKDLPRYPGNQRNQRNQKVSFVKKTGHIPPLTPIFYKHHQFSWPQVKLKYSQPQLQKRNLFEVRTENQAHRTRVTSEKKGDNTHTNKKLYFEFPRPTQLQVRFPQHKTGRIPPSNLEATPNNMWSQVGHTIPKNFPLPTKDVNFEEESEGKTSQVKIQKNFKLPLTLDLTFKPPDMENVPHQQPPDDSVRNLPKNLSNIPLNLKNTEEGKLEEEKEVTFPTTNATNCPIFIFQAEATGDRTPHHGPILGNHHMSQTNQHMAQNL